MADTAREFIKVVKSGASTKLGTLLESDQTLIAVRDTDGSTALHCATWKAHRGIVSFLLDAGADVHAHNSNDHWGTTSLHAAAHANQSAILQLLIDAGADVNANDLNGKTPLHHTTFHKANAAAKVLLKNRGV